jgi:hypothetical protein
MVCRTTRSLNEAQRQPGCDVGFAPLVVTGTPAAFRQQPLQMSGIIFSRPCPSLCGEGYQESARASGVMTRTTQAGLWVESVIDNRSASFAKY